MILLWSRHSTGPASEVIGYLLDATIRQPLPPGQPPLRRNPQPELLHGNPALVAAMIDGLETRHRYSCATLSFAPEDIDLGAWSAGDPVARRQISAAFALWSEIAFAGIAPDARPPVLVGTHRHAGRLELNLLAPRAVWAEVNGARYPRAHNPCPPIGPMRRAWAAYQDVLNMTFDWADPGDPMRAAAISGPSWIMKRAAALGRWLTPRISLSGEVAPDVAARLKAEPPQIHLMLAAREIHRTGARTRNDLLSGLEPLLNTLAWRVDHLRSDAIAFRPAADEEAHSLILRGTLCTDTPPAPSSSSIEARREFLADSPRRLSEALRSSARYNHDILSGSVATTPDFPNVLQMLSSPVPIPRSLSRRLRCLTSRLLSRVAKAVQSAALVDSLAIWASRPNEGFGAVRAQFAAIGASQALPHRSTPKPKPSIESPAP